MSSNQVEPRPLTQAFMQNPMSQTAINGPKNALSNVLNTASRSSSVQPRRVVATGELSQVRTNRRHFSDLETPGSGSIRK